MMLGVEKDLNQQECTYIAGGNVKLYMHFVEQIGNFLKC